MKMKLEHVQLAILGMKQGREAVIQDEQHGILGQLGIIHDVLQIHV